MSLCFVWCRLTKGSKRIGKEGYELRTGKGKRMKPRVPCATSGSREASRSSIATWRCAWERWAVLLFVWTAQYVGCPRSAMLHLWTLCTPCVKVWMPYGEVYPSADAMFQLQNYTKRLRWDRVCLTVRMFRLQSLNNRHKRMEFLCQWRWGMGHEFKSYLRQTYHGP
jgi:hypothetical protein